MFSFWFHTFFAHYHLFYQYARELYYFFALLFVFKFYLFRSLFICFYGCSLLPRKIILLSGRFIFYYSFLFNVLSCYVIIFLGIKNLIEDYSTIKSRFMLTNILNFLTKMFIDAIFIMGQSGYKIHVYN
jgi:hypothetical protein